MKNEQKSTWLNIVQTWIPKSPRSPVENTVQSKLSVHHSAKVHLTWKQCGTLETRSSKVVAVARCAAQWSVFLLILLSVPGIANNFRFHTFATKTFRLQAISPYSVALTQSASTRQKTGFSSKKTSALEWPTHNAEPRFFLTWV